MNLPQVPYPPEAASIELTWPEGSLATAIHEQQWLVHKAKQTTGGIVEIGTFRGVTGASLARQFPARNVFLVDYWHPQWMHGPSEQKSEFLPVREIGAEARSLPNVSLSLVRSDLFDFAPTEAGFIFIDGGHSFMQVAADTLAVMRYHAKFPRNRTIVWHDYYPDGAHQHWAGVNAFLEALNTKVPVTHVAGTILAFSDWTAETSFDAQP